MNKFLPQDNLESFFRKGLQDEMNHSSDGWDMPSDNVWEKVEMALPSSDDIADDIPPFIFWKNSKNWFSVAATVLLLVVCFQTMTNQKNIDLLSKKAAVHTNTENSDEHQNSIAHLGQGLPTSTAKEHTNNLQPDQNNTTSVKQTIQRNRIINKQTGVAVRDNIESKNITPITIHNSSVSLIENLTASTDGEELATLQMEGILPIFIKSIPEQPFEIKETYEEKNVFQYIEPVALANKKGSGFYAGTYFAPSLISRDVKGVGANAISAANDQQTIAATSYRTGIKIGYQLSDRWSVETGVSYTKHQQSRQQEINLAFDENNHAMNGAGEFEGIYNHDIQTSFGNDMPVDLSMTYLAGQNLPTNGSQLPIKVGSEETLEFVQVPVSAKYSIGKGKLQLNVSAGAMANVLVNQTVALKTPSNQVASPDPAMEIKHKKSELIGGNELSGMKKISYSLIANVALDYELKDNLHVYVAPGFAKGITPVYENEVVAISQSQASTEVGMNYYF